MSGLPAGGTAPGGTDPSRVRNFCIVAHIDHGKSTLADRILLSTGAITDREFRDQVLDDMDLERERGITIKASSVRLLLRRPGGPYVLNLIDTPGHVDFGYEVVRSLRACEGAILLVDATQGIQAQTVANYTHALSVGLAVIPVLNKIDLGTARPDEVIQEMEQTFGFRPEEVLRISAKEGIGVDAVLDAVVNRIPAPSGRPGALPRALVFDSRYDDHRGVVLLVRVVDGRLERGQAVELLSNGRRYTVQSLGVLSPAEQPCDALGVGEVGACCANIREIQEVRPGETLTLSGGREQGVEPLPGYAEPLQVVFCGLYPVDADDFEKLRDALRRLQLNDASFVFAPERSEGLGNGFRCGFLGLLHMDIIRERLEREWSLELIQTAPNVTYEVLLPGERVLRVDSPSAIPDGQIMEIREPIARTQLLVPAASIGPTMHLAQDRRGRLVKTEYLGTNRVLLLFDLPLAEIIYDFHDQLKSITHGYGTMDYDRPTYEAADVVRLDVLVAGRRVDALSTVVHRDAAARRGRTLLLRLRKEIPRHLFEVVLQAAIGGKIIARESIRAVGKQVTAKCYGGDITRKRKLWEKQKEGKKRMKQVGLVEIPQEAFLKVLDPGEDA